MILKPFRILLFVVIGVSVAVGVSQVLYPLIVERNRLMAQRAAAVEDNEHLRKKISEIKQQQNDFQNDPEYIELVARMQGLVKRNEVIFDFSHLPPITE